MKFEMFYCYVNDVSHNRGKKAYYVARVKDRILWITYVDPCDASFVSDGKIKVYETIKGVLGNSVKLGEFSTVKKAKKFVEEYSNTL